MLNSQPRSRGLIRLAAAIVGLPLLFLLLMTAYYFLPTAARTDTVRVQPDSNLRQIVDRLYAKKLLRFPNLFVLTVRLKKEERKLQAGLYEIKAGSSPRLILHKLLKGETATVRVTIPEGWSSREIGELLERKDLCPRESFLSVVEARQLEGFLFPNTYFVPSQFTAEGIALLFVKGFESFWSADYETRARAQNLSVRSIITLASIIEREAKLDSEKPIISSVFYNRLRRGMKLEADPTILYALGSWNIRLTRRQLFTRSPYNTYLHRGLPPGPICNPGKTSLLAALNPARHLGPALLAGGSFLGQFWIYWVGPVLGGIVAGAVYKAFIEAPEGKAN